MLYVGCPIWSFKGWVGNFYPKGTKPADFLFQYARRLTDFEGNTTFYAVPSKETLENWVEQMPETFRFFPKVPKAISHEGKLAENIDKALGFVDIMRGLGTRLGPMFLQLPPRFSPNLLTDLGAFLSLWPADVRLAVEVRHLDWFDSPHDEALDALLTEHNMARVTIDTRPIRSLQGDKLLTGSTYESLLEARERKPDVPEHGWSSQGVFNFEGGCYAKVIRLSAEAEPEIYATTRRFRTILENVVFDPVSRHIDLDDDMITENTRCSYPIDFIPNIVKEGYVHKHPKNIIFLTCDASGVMPPIARLSPEQAQYHFISGYTSKIAGTEIGLGIEPQITFSACFGGPFMVRHPYDYSQMLKESMLNAQSKCLACKHRMGRRKIWSWKTTGCAREAR